jgi:3-oxoacyl-[acyl-carrier protein] reductase
VASLGEKQKYILMKLLEGKTALITGASRGIGRTIAMKFAIEGASIAITNVAEDEEFLNTIEEIKAHKVNVKGYVSNAADFADSQRVIDEIVRDFGRIDILVNNAGITRDNLLMRMTEEQWDLVIGVNLKSVFNLTKAVLQTMVRQKNGSIINMSSVVGVSGNAGQSNYSASKAGMIGFTKSIAKEVGSRNIRCNAIAPGFIITEMTEKLPPDVKTEWIGKIPLRRGGTPEDVANTALYLASDLSSYVSGQTIHVCGGMLT